MMKQEKPVCRNRLPLQCFGETMDHLPGTPAMQVQIDDRATAERIAFYESARDELIQRLALRDQSIIAYIATAGAYFAFVLGPDSIKSSAQTVSSEAAMVMVLPILSLVFTYITQQHHVMIGTLSQFSRSICSEEPWHWDAYYVLSADKGYLSARTISQGLLLILPVAYTAVFTLRALNLVQSTGAALVVAAVLVFDVIILILIVRVHLWAYRARLVTDKLAPDFAEST
jgi:hypothetical protein